MGQRMSWLQVRGEKREWSTLPTAASPRSTSLTLLLGFGGGAVVSVILPVEHWLVVGVAVKLINGIASLGSSGVSTNCSGNVCVLLKEMRKCSRT
jgi:hypothetical protein